MTLATFSLGNIIGTEIFLPKDGVCFISPLTSPLILLQRLGTFRVQYLLVPFRDHRNNTSSSLHSGKIAIMILLTVQLGICLLLRWVNLRLNAQKRRLIEKTKAERGWTDADVQREREKHAFLDMTDKQ
jgi:hypothetical protein